MSWNPLFNVEIPQGLNPCRLCNSNCMVAEGVEDGFSRPARGVLIRIWSNCNQSTNMEKDDIRTEFGKEEDTIAEWNEMNTERIQT